MEKRIDVYADALADIAFLYEVSKGVGPEHKAKFFDDIGAVLTRVRASINSLDLAATA